MTNSPSLSGIVLAMDELLQAEAESTRGGLRRVPLMERPGVCDDPFTELLPEIQGAAVQRRVKTEAERKRKARHTKGANKTIR